MVRHDNRKTSGNSARRFAKGLADTIDLTSSIGTLLGTIGMIGLLVMMFAGVMVNLFSDLLPDLPGAISVGWEYSSYCLAGVFTLGAGPALARGAHIRVTALTSRLNPRAQTSLYVVTNLIGFGAIAYVCYAVFVGLLKVYARGTVSTASFTQLWIPYSIIFLGLTLFALQILAQVLRALIRLPIESGDTENGVH